MNKKNPKTGKLFNSPSEKKTKSKKIKAANFYQQNYRQSSKSIDNYKTETKYAHNLALKSSQAFYASSRANKRQFLVGFSELLNGKTISFRHHMFI